MKCIYRMIVEINLNFASISFQSISKQFFTLNICSAQNKKRKCKKNKSDFTWVIDPIDGTRSFIIGNPTWSNLIGLNYKGNPVVGLANFPKLNKYYLNTSTKNAYVIEKGKKRKLQVNKKATLKNMKVAGAFHGWLSLKKQSKIPKVLNL